MQPELYFWENQKTLFGKSLHYLARIEELALENEDGRAVTTMYSYAYLALPEDTERPVVFCYNGGPGSDSSWLHIGMLGPKTVRFPSYPDGENPGNFELVENGEFLLDTCDLVLIDPTGTSYARLLDVSAERECYSTIGDAKNFARFIQIWLQKYHRENAPVYLLGESYGTIRSIAIADALPEDIRLHGIISIGTSFNFGAKTTMLVEPNVRRLGACAAGCWYHYHRNEIGKEEFVRQAMDFAYGDYAHALLLGNRIDREMREKVLDKLNYFSGLDRSFLDKNKLRFSELDFLTGLCPGKIVSMYDSRLTGPFEPQKPNGNETDSKNINVDLSQEPFFAVVDKQIQKAFKQYIEQDLVHPTDREPNSSGFKIALNWDYQSYSKDMITLPAELMAQKQHLRILFINGSYDLSSTFDFVIYYLSQYELPTDRVEHKIYESGHATYIGADTAADVSRDIRKFIRGESQCY